MILSQTFFPTNLAARAVWCVNFSKQFEDVGPSLGFSAAEIKSAKDDSAMMQFLADSFAQLKAYDGAMGQFRRILTEGDIGDPTPAAPADPAFVFPTAVATGLFERTSDLIARIKVAPNYTAEIGALLGILPSQPDSIAPGEVKPSITVSAAATGYLFSVVVAGRAESDMWDVFILRKGAADWTSAGRFTGKSADVTITPATPGDTEQFQVRVQLRKSNQNYGQPSDVVYVTVNP